MPSSSSRSPREGDGATPRRLPGAGDDAAVVRRFVEASRRAEIVALLNEAGSAAEVARVAVDELSEAFDAEVALVATATRDAGLAVPASVGLSAPQARAAAADPEATAALVGARARTLRGQDVLGLPGAREALLAGFQGHAGLGVLLGVARLYPAAFDPGEIALHEAVTQSVGHALERWWLSEERDRNAARQAALARAATLVNASLVREEVVATLADEASRALGAEVVLLALADGGGPLEVVGGRGLPDGLRGMPCAPGGLCERVARTGVPAVVQPFDGPLEVGVPDVLGVRSGAAVPLRRAGEVDGALLVGHRDGRWTDAADVELLVAFGELTSGALRNADEHAAAQRAATLDPLTGSLNHGAFMARVHEEIARAERAGATGGLSLVLLDLDDFKSVNDRFGHLRGDAVLRRVAEALRAVGRTYDRVGRYGGDEFALLLPSTDTRTARRVADRALASLAAVPLPGGGFVSAMAGVAEWAPGDDPSDLVDRADLELLAAKRTRRRPGARGGAPPPPDERDELQLRRMATVGALGARLAKLLDQRAIADTAMRELAATLGYERCLLVRRTPDGQLAVVASRTGVAAPAEAPTAEPDLGRALHRALAEGRTVLDPEMRVDHVRSELAVPVEVGGELWGALALRASLASGLDEHDARVVEGVAEHVGAALRTAELVHELDRAHLGTAAALAAALEAKDSYTAEHAASIADLAVDVGRMLGLAEDDLRDLRLGAIFHDIGKIAIPDAILGKEGPLDADEVAVIRGHPEAGEQILAPVPFLAGVRRIVRHDHERWDGGGYPDGLHGEEIPAGARIVLVVDAWHAMTSDRPYRAAMAPEEARAELLAHAGTQFDPAVVSALLRVLEPARG